MSDDLVDITQVLNPNLANPADLSGMSSGALAILKEQLSKAKTALTDHLGEFNTRLMEAQVYEEETKATWTEEDETYPDRLRDAQKSVDVGGGKPAIAHLKRLQAEGNVVIAKFKTRVKAKARRVHLTESIATLKKWERRFDRKMREVESALQSAKSANDESKSVA